MAWPAAPCSRAADELHPHQPDCLTHLSHPLARISAARPRSGCRFRARQGPHCGRCGASGGWAVAALRARVVWFRRCLCVAWRRRLQSYTGAPASWWRRGVWWWWRRMGCVAGVHISQLNTCVASLGPHPTHARSRCPRTRQVFARAAPGRRKKTGQSAWPTRAWTRGLGCPRFPRRNTFALPRSCFPLITSSLCRGRIVFASRPGRRWTTVRHAPWGLIAR